MKQTIIAAIIGKFSELGVPVSAGNGADITIQTEFLDAGWSTGDKKITYEASIFLDEASQTAFMWEKTTEVGHGLSFGGDSGSSFQTGTTLFRKVKSVQYATDGKVYEYTLDLGAIPKTVKENAKQNNWKFKTVLNRSKASYPPGYVPQETVPVATPTTTVPTAAESSPPVQSSAGYCANCGMPLPVGANFCQKCGLPLAGTVGTPMPSMAPPPPPQPSVQTTPVGPAPIQQTTPLYMDPQGALYAQTTPAKPKDGKPSVGSSILFWIIWSFTSLVSLIMLIDEFSVVRLLGMAVVIGLPLVLRKTLFRKAILSLIGWFCIYILLFLILGTTGSPSGISRENDPNWKVEKQNDVTVAVLAGVLPANGTINVVKDPNPPAPQVEGISMEAYEIGLPSQSVMDGVADIELPYDTGKIPFGAKPEEVLAAVYFDPGQNQWVPVPYLITKSGRLTILIDHFSKYGVVYFKDGRKKLGETIPAFDGMGTSLYDDSELERIIAGMGDGSSSNMAALNAGWNQFNTYYGLTGASATALGAAVDSKTLTNINNLMTEVGMGFAFAQVALDIYNGDRNAAVNNFLKNSAYYSASKWGGSAIGLASAGVTFMDVALNKFGEKALEKNLQKWENAYRHYYETNPSVKRTAVDWYKIVAQLHQESTGPDDFKQKVNMAIAQYADVFWKDAEGYAYVAESTPGLRGFGAGGEYGQGVSEISKRYQAYIYGTTMKSVMAVLMKKLWLQEYRKAEARFAQLKAEMNRVYTIRVNLANYNRVANLGRTSVRFINARGQVVHSQSFDGTGVAGVRTTLFGFLKAGTPAKIEVKVPAQDSTPAYETSLSFTLNSTDIRLSIPYSPLDQPQATPKQIATSTQLPRTASRPSPVVQRPTMAPAKTQPPQPEYNYSAAVAAWAADYAAEVNSRKYDNGICKTTTEFEWVMAPVIRDGQVVGASRIWQTNSYYAGEHKGKSFRNTVNEAYSPSNPGPYISVAELKRKYPQFGK